MSYSSLKYHYAAIAISQRECLNFERVLSGVLRKKTFLKMIGVSKRGSTYCTFSPFSRIVDLKWNIPEKYTVNPCVGSVSCFSCFFKHFSWKFPRIWLVCTDELHFHSFLKAASNKIIKTNAFLEYLTKRRTETIGSSFDHGCCKTHPTEHNSHGHNQQRDN